MDCVKYRLLVMYNKALCEASSSSIEILSFISYINLPLYRLLEARRVYYTRDKFIKITYELI